MYNRKPLIGLYFRYNNPCKLPCGHTYCRTPCILSQPMSSTASCFSCEIAVPAYDLEIDEAAVQRVNTFLKKSVKPTQVLSSQQERIVNPLSVLGEFEPFTCAACYQLGPSIDVCLHCSKKICSICRDQHIENVIFKSYLVCLHTHCLHPRFLTIIMHC